MERLKKLTGFFLCIGIVISSLCLMVNGTEIENEKKYKPLDLVVVLDSSGSMNDSDKDRTALAAVRMLVNMMPAEDSKVGIVGFNRNATVLTKDAKGNEALLNLESLTDVATIKKNVSDVVYNGGTGIGNAVLKATELLNADKADDRTQAIILFTDGVNDFGKDAMALSNCEDNEASALLWAKKNDCPIYCVGYDYIMSDGTSSMGVNGEGLKKLKNISSTTQGRYKSIKSIDEIEQLLIEFLADVCDLNYTTVATIPGDGGKHECFIPVSPSVVEANIRIAGGDENAIAKGKIQLFDPDGNEIELRNSGNVRFDTDATAASIKVTMPKTGKWLLVVEGISGDEIHVGLLEHFKMNLTSKITLPDGNPNGVAYSNDEVGIKAWLTYDGQDLNDDAIYSSVKSATAVCVPRANPEKKKIINLKRDGLSYVGSFIIPEDCFYDITIRLDWDTVYREDTLEIQSSNKPLYIKAEIPDVKVNKKKTVTVNDIYQYVADDENDKIEASVASMSNANVADVDIQGDSLTVKGNKWSSTLVTLSYKDAQGNTVEATFKVKVNDPVAIALIAFFILLIVAAVIALLILTKKASNKVSGRMRVVSIAEGIVDSSGDYKNTKIIYSNSNVNHDVSVVGGANAGSVFSGAATSAFPNTNASAGGTDPFNPLGGSVNPFAGGANPFGNADPMLGGGANPFGNADPMSGAAPAAFGSGNPFDKPFEAPKANEPAQAAPDDIFDVFGTPAVPFASAQSAASTISQEEENRSNGFNEKFLIGGSKVRNTDMAKVMDLFIKYYCEYMNAGVSESKKAALVKDFVEGNLRPLLVRVRLLGTLYGKSGVILCAEKGLLPGKLICHSPKLVKNKASMNPNNKRVTLSISIPNGEKKSDGTIPCSHIEIEYTK